MSLAIRIVFVALLASPVLAQQTAQAPPAPPPPAPMGFFITSAPKDGGNLGGLEGADAHCQALAKAVGAGNRTWRAYLSTQAQDGKPAVNARDRIGKGPWANQKGQIVARDLAHLHGDTLELAQPGNAIHRMSALNEKGELVNAAGQTPNHHDILTGSTASGLAIGGDSDRTCRNWTSNSDGSAQVGHHDRTGGPNTSWNSVHPSRGCSLQALQGSGGNGLFYCFAAD